MRLPKLHITRYHIFGVFFVLVSVMVFGLLPDGNYTVVEGDRLSDLAAEFRVDQGAIIAANDLTLVTGSRLVIPNIAAGSNYTVEEGDTLASLAESHQITEAEIIAANQLTDPTLAVGQELVIPHIRAGNNYLAEEGDTVRKLAEKFQLSEQAIVSINRLRSEDITPGQELVIPSIYSADATSTLSFGIGLNAPSWAVPTRLTMLLVAILYLLGGIMGLINRWPRAARWLLITNGILIFPAILIGAAVGKQTNVLTMLVESTRLATPIAIGAAAGIWSERSGVINIAIEGMLLTGAAMGFITYVLLEPALDSLYMAQSLGVLAAVISGGLMALLHGWLSITFKTDQIVSGTVINILAIGITSFFRREVLFSSEAGRITLPTNLTILSNLPGVGEFFINLSAALSKIPIIGDLINEIFFGGKPIFISMFIILIATQIILFYTPMGLRIRAVGEHPQAADTVGINVIRTRYRNVIISGMIAGLGGAWFSLETVGGFTDEMTGGRGFISLAAVIFGNWKPGGAFLGALLFGFSDALATRFQILQVPVPPQWLQMLPFITTMVVLAGLIGRSTPPAAIGQPYEK